MPYHVIWMPPLLQILMVSQLENQPWLKHEEAVSVLWTRWEGIVFAIALSLVAMMSTGIIYSLRCIWSLSDQQTVATS
jgi:hypothetical protein